MSEGRWSFGCLSALAWLFVAFLGTLVSAVAIGMSGYQSESLGVTASYVMALPLGLLWSGAFTAVVVYLATDRNHDKRLHIGAPLGCGCLGALVFPVLLWVFYVGIWPSL
jgi:hypothetical protein